MVTPLIERRSVMNKILLVEDSKEIYRMVSLSLASLVELDWAETVESATKKLKLNKYNLILLDVELPDGNGIELCSQLQLDMPEVPVFFLTSHAELSNKVLGFSAGADDYISKPFDPLELRARIEAKMRKSQILQNSSDIMKFKELEINKSSQEVRILNKGEFELADLTALELKILIYFANQVGKVIPRDQILDDIWGKDVHVYARSVDTHVSKLRKKLGPVAHVLDSIHGSGYKFVATK